MLSIGILILSQMVGRMILMLIGVHLYLLSQGINAWAVLGLALVTLYGHTVLFECRRLRTLLKIESLVLLQTGFIVPLIMDRWHNYKLLLYPLFFLFGFILSYLNREE